MKKYILIVATILFIVSGILIIKEKDKFYKAIQDPKKAIHIIELKIQNWIITNRIHRQYNKEEKFIYMRDSIRLFTSIYTPKDKTEKYPILIWRTPYNSEPFKNKYSNNLRSMLHLLKEKYIIVFQDVRGRYMSEGEFLDVRPYNPEKKKDETDENSDTFDTIDWLIKNVANNNGRVGIFGISYPGFYSTISLPHSHPALKAVSPQAPVINWFGGDDWHHNGAFFLLDAFSFYANFGRPRPQPTRTSPPPFEYNNEDNYDLFKDIGPIKNIQKFIFGDSIQFWSELMTHPNYDDFWKERNILSHLANIEPATLVVGGWFDAENLQGSLNLYKSIEEQNKPGNKNNLIMGPWYHTQWTLEKAENVGNIHFGTNTSEYFKKQELAFFNYYLKNKGEMNFPEASIFITGANKWMDFNSWPPKDTVIKNLYLNNNEQLSYTKPEIKECYDEYFVDPNKPIAYTEDVHLTRTKDYLTDDQRFSSRRPDVMIYQTGQLNEDITVVGSIDVSLFVSTTGTDADYIVKLIDVFPDQISDYPNNEKNVPLEGYQMLVRAEVLRGKYRNSLEDPEPILPNEITEISFKLPDVAHQFSKGHKVMVHIQNSWFPLVDINPQSFLNIYEAEKKDFIKAKHRIYHDSQNPSKISIKILEN